MTIEYSEGPEYSTEKIDPILGLKPKKITFLKLYRLESILGPYIKNMKFF